MLFAVLSALEQEIGGRRVTPMCQTAVCVCVCVCVCVRVCVRVCEQSRLQASTMRTQLTQYPGTVADL